MIADVDGQPAGVGALRQLDRGVVEVKRMYVHPDYRDRRLGSGVLDLLLTEAAATFQAKTVRLDTCRFMLSAQRLYRSRGFHERPPYEGTEIPLHLQRYWMFFEKRLVSCASGWTSLRSEVSDWRASATGLSAQACHKGARGDVPRSATFLGKLVNPTPCAKSVRNCACSKARTRPDQGNNFPRFLPYEGGGAADEYGSHLIKTPASPATRLRAA